MLSGQKKKTLKENKKDAILQAAWGLIRHYGYTKTTIDDIAKRAGIGKGTIYLHFHSKLEIMLALVELTNDRIIKDLEEISLKKSPPSDRLRECLLHRIMTLFDIVHRYPHGEDVISSMLPDIVKRLERYVRRHGELLENIIRDGITSGDFCVDDPKKKGQMLAHLFEHFTPPYYRFRSRNALENFANQVIDILFTGICPTS